MCSAALEAFGTGRLLSVVGFGAELLLFVHSYVFVFVLIKLFLRINSTYINSIYIYI